MDWRQVRERGLGSRQALGQSQLISQVCAASAGCNLSNSFKNSISDQMPVMLGSRQLPSLVKKKLQHGMLLFRQLIHKMSWFFLSMWHRQGLHT